MATATQSDGPMKLSDRIEPFLAIIGPMVMILAILLFMGIAEPARYFRLSNLNLILLDAALYMPMAMAMTFVITQRGIDLSIGSVAALSSIIMAFLIKQYGFSAPVAIAIALLLGAVFGLINGLVITKFKVPDLIGTLAMDLVYRGFALVIAKGLVLARFPEIMTDIGRGQIPGFIPLPVVIGLFTMVLGYWLLKKTYFGRYTVAIGSNPEAAEMTGIAVDRYKIYAYVLMGASAALAGVMLTGKLNAIQATSAPYFNLHVIAAVVVGGTSLFGGRASMLGSLAGVLLLSMMINALVTLRIEFFWQSVASGVVIVSSVALYTWLQKKDRDGAKGLLAGLKTPESLRLLRLSGGLIAALALLLLIGTLLAGNPVASG
ncbi:MAG: ABC transporter permease [Roseibium album]|uniref:ABC transporter permease n=1 Tax=Roseibium album TaxID=311410 RepID=UPI001A32A687|nr:ABC transporter permease [Roseibium album]MBG6144854.1 ribose transport system permease protein [Labrenzia sp. EL_142]MBG6156929.1 ribose transport system permease protein [Labrenzia sp. EL_162]MBG6163460.1 ribose transport system permease protein [Labrenzia sp. EL_195]MBG6172992.1 ribose transport system permease protein [Labrenzia sp. EL_132]MBG6195130.1 ribose transport system permease protein [Labrenzia sp. EL_159]MBG6203289.1 ribose transport system permease protein [Labrenzia sp. EL_